MDGTGLSARLGPGSHGALAALLGMPAVCVSSGCSNRVPQLGGLKRQKFCASRCSRPAAWGQRRRLWILGPEVRNQGAARPSSRGAPLGSSPGSGSSLVHCVLLHLGLCLHRPVPQDWPALLRYDLALTNRVCKGSVSSSAHVRRSWGLGLQPIFSGEGQNSTHVE